MATLSNYGFILDGAEEMPEETYNDISGVLCNICTMTEYAIGNKPHTPIMFSFILNKNPNVYGTFCAVDNQVHFGIFYNGKVYRKGHVKLFSTFCSKEASDILSKRCYHQICLVLEGKIPAEVLATDEVIDAWEKEMPLSFFAESDNDTR